jgi:hypothetical protein
MNTFTKLNVALISEFLDYSREFCRFRRTCTTLRRICLTLGSGKVSWNNVCFSDSHFKPDGTLPFKVFSLFVSLWAPRESDGSFWAVRASHQIRTVLAYAKSLEVHSTMGKRTRLDFGFLAKMQRLECLTLSRRRDDDDDELLQLKRRHCNVRELFQHSTLTKLCVGATALKSLLWMVYWLISAASGPDNLLFYATYRAVIERLSNSLSPRSKRVAVELPPNFRIKTFVFNYDDYTYGGESPLTKWQISRLLWLLLPGIESWTLNGGVKSAFILQCYQAASIRQLSLSFPLSNMIREIRSFFGAFRVNRLSISNMIDDVQGPSLLSLSFTLALCRCLFSFQMTTITVFVRLPWKTTTTRRQ